MQITIIGTGLIGGSLALALKQLSPPPKIIGVDKKPEVIDTALFLKAVDEGTTSLEEGVKNSDIVFIATPVGTIVKIIKKIIPHLKPSSIVTDTGSVKARIVEEVEKFLPPKIYFIGGHPMAGSEKEGITAASGFLFKNSYYLLTPTPKIDTEVFKRLHSLLTQIGARVLTIDAKKHDLAMATISHLPHLVSASLVNLAVNQIDKTENLLQLAAGGFRDMTRTANSNPELWLDIVFENDSAILKVLKEFRNELEEIVRLIKVKDRIKLFKKLKEARRIRQNLPRILHKDLSQLRELSIPVEDEPGVISDITLTVGQLGINIEDVEIIRAPASRSGILGLVILGEESAQKASRALRKKGYRAEIKRIYSKEMLEELGE